MAKGKKPRIQGFPRNRKLYQAIIEGDNEAALQEIIKEEDPVIYELPVNASYDTLLHVAISKGKWKIAGMILSSMDPEQLEKKNLKGDTPLHEVASKGEPTTSKEESLKVAKGIVSINSGLLHMRNTQQEIPLHKAALNGHTDMFDYLYSQGSNVFARSEGGTTVLHCAVMGTHLELAEKIVTMCPDLRLLLDHQGMTPLHLLVVNPKTFKSGSRLGTIASFIYKRILPKEDIPVYKGDEDGKQADHIGGDEDGKKPKDHVALFVAGEDKDDIQPDHTGGDEDGKKSMDGVSLAVSDEHKDDRQPDHTGGDENGKKPMNGVSLAGADEDKQSKPTRSDIPHRSKKTLDEKLPPNYVTCFNIGRWMHSLCSVIARWRHSSPLFSVIARWRHSSPLFFIVSKTNPGFNKIVEQKRMHGQALRLVGPLSEKGRSRIDYWTQLSKGRSPAEISSDTYEIETLDIKHDGKNGGGLNLNGADRGPELPHILAVKMGATSFVDRILTANQKLVTLTGDDRKNILHVAVEHRQEKIVRLIESTEDWQRITVSGKDKKSDTILHSAARIGDNLENLVPGTAFQIQREFQWFERVERLIPRELVYHRNLDGKTARELFTSCHADMIRSIKVQLIETAQACSALVAAVVFATSFSTPGGTDDKSGLSLFLNKPAFRVFTNAYVVGLSSAATALLMFLSLIIAPYNEQEFRRSLPTKFLLAFASLFLALACMLVAFSSNIYLTINGKRKAGDIVPLVCELTIFPAFAFAMLFYQRANFGFLSTLKDVCFLIRSSSSSGLPQR